MRRTVAQVAELVDALVSGTSGESRGGSSPLLGTIALKFYNKFICVLAGESLRAKH